MVWTLEVGVVLDIFLNKLQFANSSRKVVYVIQGIKHINCIFGFFLPSSFLKIEVTYSYFYFFNTKYRIFDLNLDFFRRLFKTVSVMINAKFFSWCVKKSVTLGLKRTLKKKSMRVIVVIWKKKSKCVILFPKCVATMSKYFTVE